MPCDLAAVRSAPCPEHGMELSTMCPIISSNPSDPECVHPAPHCSSKSSESTPWSRNKESLTAHKLDDAFFPAVMTLLDGVLVQLRPIKRIAVTT